MIQDATNKTEILHSHTETRLGINKKRYKGNWPFRAAHSQTLSRTTVSTSTPHYVLHHRLGPQDLQGQSLQSIFDKEDGNQKANSPPFMEDNYQRELLSLLPCMISNMVVPRNASLFIRRRLVPVCLANCSRNSPPRSISSHLPLPTSLI